MKFDPVNRKDILQTLVSSYKEEDSQSLKIHQDARISRLDLSKNKVFNYRLKSKDHGVYVMLISGEIIVSDRKLKTRDAIGIYETSDFIFTSNQDSEILFIEIPMVFNDYI